LDELGGVTFTEELRRSRPERWRLAGWLGARPRRRGAWQNVEGWRVGGGTRAWPTGEDASAPSRNLRHILIVMLRDDLLQRITIDPNVCFGTPCIRGTRIWVEVIVENLAAGASEQEILNVYPALTADDIDAALTYASERSGR
jgi:uncharacterized protein (DUF433 family)